VQRREEQAKRIMTKSELIETIARKQKHLPAKDVELAVKHLLDLMSDSLSKGERIEIRGFGSFSLHFRPPRIGRNPKTGEAVALSGKYVPHFKPGKDLRERVNEYFLQSNKLSRYMPAGYGLCAGHVESLNAEKDRHRNIGNRRFCGHAGVYEQQSGICRSGSVFLHYSAVHPAGVLCDFCDWLGFRSSLHGCFHTPARQRTQTAPAPAAPF
jgi:integration host factor subunit beta